MSGNSSSGPGKTPFPGLKYLEQGRQSECVEGNENEEKNEAEGETYRWVLHPRCHLRHYYLVFMVVLTFANLITIPLDMAFSDDMQDNAHKYWVAFNVFSDIMFCIDVGFNFRMGIFSEDGQAILDPKLIRKDYFSSWFVPDVVAAFPVDIIIIIVEHFYHADTLSLVASKMVRILMFVRVLSLIRLLRVPKLLRFCFELENVSDIQLEVVRKSFRVFFVFLMMVLIWHWNTCVQYFLSVMEEFPQDCWVVQEKIVNNSIGEKYSYASFRAFSQMAWRSTESIYSPRRVDERWIAIVSMVIGYVMCFAFISCLVSAVGCMSVTGSGYKLKDIMAEICSSMLNKDSMFMKLNREFTEAILIKLENEFFNPGDIIIHQNAAADHMFFIDYGRVLVMNESFHMELCDGDHFGEISFLFGGRQLATVSALTTCSLFSLSFQEFQEIEKEFPHVVNELRAAAQQLKNDLESDELCLQVTSASSSV
ncbi:Potassium/sodium hyperpolarization-activated cyclic nucleotide-gated channel 1 [Anabarilius grahami]|uniref:Potassium/sodium hyperpolarization-activated cyclic nucleotide-gated channel 1 n=1 Tax=Anabarilius grahami TaxID=495550 RepID=A0A3N0YT16_ANAGA|nr:Potassium/sodium hyperpolarization-activated cyclic nucleotide-gated channel 1 [Anabarilius grahami]